MNTMTLLPKAIAQLPIAEGEFSPVVTLQDGPLVGIPLDRVCDTTLDTWLAAEIASAEGANEKYAAASLIGSLSWTLSEVLGGLVLQGFNLIATPPQAIALSARQVIWDNDGESETSSVFDVILNPKPISLTLEQETGNYHGFQTLFEALHSPLVNGLHTRSHLSTAALWRIVGDSLSAVLLAHGKLLNNPERAMKLALAMLRNSGTRLYSKQTHFVRIALPERPEVAEWFRVRGGCCRYYTIPNKEYCTTCILRAPESRNARLLNYVRSKHSEQVTNS